MVIITQPFYSGFSFILGTSRGPAPFHPPSPNLCPAPLWLLPSPAQLCPGPALPKSLPNPCPAQPSLAKPLPSPALPSPNPCPAPAQPCSSPCPAQPSPAPAQPLPGPCLPGVQHRLEPACTRVASRGRTAWAPPSAACRLPWLDPDSGQMLTLTRPGPRREEHCACAASGPGWRDAGGGGAAPGGRGDRCPSQTRLCHLLAPGPHCTRREVAARRPSRAVVPTGPPRGGTWREGAEGFGAASPGRGRRLHRGTGCGAASIKCHPIVKRRFQTAKMMTRL